MRVHIAGGITYLEKDCLSPGSVLLTLPAPCCFCLCREGTSSNVRWILDDAVPGSTPHPWPIVLPLCPEVPLAMHVTFAP